MTPDPRDGSRKPERSTLLTVEEARAWAIAIAKEINRDAPPRPPDPWNVAWQPHNEDIQLCYVPSTRSFMIRARVDHANSVEFSQVIEAMVGILNLGAPPPPPSPFAWPVLSNTWTGCSDFEKD